MANANVAQSPAPKSAVNTNKPELDTQTIERMERGASSQGTGQVRRVCLATMGRSLEDLNECSKRDPETFKVLVTASNEFRDHAKALLELANAAVFRLSLADEHGDMDAVLASVMPSKKGMKAIHV